MFIAPSDIQVPLVAANDAYRGIFRTQMMKVFEKQFFEHVPLIKKVININDDAENWKGTYAEFTVELERIGDAYVTRDDGQVPEGEFTVPKYGRVGEIVTGVSFQFTEGMAWSQGGGTDVQRVKPFAYQLERKMKDFAELFTRQLYGMSDATLGTVASETGGVITLSEGQNKQFLSRMKVEVWTVTGAAGSEVWALHKGDVYIKEVGLTTPTVTVSGTKYGVAGAGYAFAFAANDRLVIRGAAQAGAACIGSSLQGLDEMADDGTKVVDFEGISRDTWPEWCALRMGAAAVGTGPLTTRLMHNFVMGQRQVGTGNPTMLLVDPAVTTEGFELFQPIIQTTPGGKVTGGFSGLRFESGDISVELMRDWSMPAGKMFLIDPKAVDLLVKKRFGYRPIGYNEAGQPVLTDAKFMTNRRRLRAEGDLNMVCNTVCYRPSGLAQLERITTANAIFPVR